MARQNNVARFDLACSLVLASKLELILRQQVNYDLPNKIIISLKSGPVKKITIHARYDLVLLPIDNPTSQPDPEHQKTDHDFLLDSHWAIQPSSIIAVP